VYRTWFKDTSPLVNRLKNKAAAVVSTSSFEPATFLDKAQLPLTVELLPTGEFRQGCNVSDTKLRHWESLL